MAIALLTSGATLGTHVPALILAHRLRAAGADVRVEVFERLLKPSELHRLRQAKGPFRANFAAAVAAQRLVRDQSAALDDQAVAELLDRWRAARVDMIVTFTGFWVPIIERYEQSLDTPPEVDVCHLDSAPTASFKLYAARTERYRHVWMFDAEQGTIPLSIPVTDETPVPWASRERRLLAHGGGWGLGTYRARAREVIDHGFQVDIVAHDWADVGELPDGSRFFMIDPGWEAWQDAAFPPFGEVMPDGSVAYRRCAEHHDSFHLARRSYAMLCKTGGGTLIDSLWAATPIVLLEPFGAHEKVNAALWRRLGFGVDFETWRTGGFSVALLERFHRNLIRARDGVADYAAVLATRPAPSSTRPTT